MPRLSPLPDELTSVPFRVADALEAGIGKGRLRSADLARPFHGIRSPTTSPSARPLIAAYATTMLEHQFFSHLTAAELHGLRLPARLSGLDVVHVGVAPPARLPRGRNVTGHELRAKDVTLTEVDGFRTVSAIDAWRQLAPLASVDDLIVAGDGLVSRVGAVATIAQLERAVAESRRLRGVPLLREALPWIRSGTDSARETRLRLMIVRAGLPEPEVNVRITNRYGAFVAYGDLVYRKWRIVIEYDGAQHREDEGQYNRDIDRLDDLMEDRWRVIRVNKDLLRFRRAVVIGRIRTALLDAGWRPHAPSQL